MKILLVYPSLFPGGSGVAFPMPPLTVLHLAGLARHVGHEVDVLEPSRFARSALDDGALQQRLGGVDLVGVSCTSINWHEGRRFIGRLRELRPELPVVVGGVHATCFDEHLLDGGGPDYVICGEGERGWLELLERLERHPRPDLDGIPGLSARDGDGAIVRQPRPDPLDGEALGRLALPAYDLVPENTYAVLPFETSRGCYYSCAFCSITHQGSWRAAQPQRIFERLAQVIDEHGSRFRSSTVCFVDDCFTAVPEHVEGVCGALQRAGVRHSFMLESRVTDLLEDRVLDSLLQISLAEIQIGVECGYDEGLRRIRKGLKVDSVRTCAARLAAAGVAPRVMYSLILGLPWEDLEACRKTLDFGAELTLRWGGVVNFSWWIPIPSLLWQHRAEYGIDAGDDLFDRPNWVEDSRTFWQTHPHLSPDAVMELRQSANAYRRQGARLFGI